MKKKTVKWLVILTIIAVVVAAVVLTYLSEPGTSWLARYGSVEGCTEAWKRGEITMENLLDCIKEWKAG